MIHAYIALGSNLQNPQQQLHRAVTALGKLDDSHIERISSVYCSAAVGPGVQPDYLNAVLLLLTALHPDALLAALQTIEQHQGRVRGTRWGPRTLDLDLLLYGDQVIDTPQLTVPHPRMTERDFVLYPLREISDTTLVLPGGTDIDTLVRQCPGDGLVKTVCQLETNQ